MSNLDEEIDRILRLNASSAIDLHINPRPQKGNRAYNHEHIQAIKSLIADREKKMLEFILPDKKKVNEYYGTRNSSVLPHDYYTPKGYNKAIDTIRQRAKEWEKQNER